ncbi:MAG: hypothetical protein AAGA03_14760 [Planctomycetota bacterium]
MSRLADAISSEAGGESIGIVTNSLGDWVTRGAIASSPTHRVRTLVSLAFSSKPESGNANRH